LTSICHQPLIDIQNLCRIRSELTSDGRIRDLASKLRGRDLANISPGTTTRHGAASPGETSDDEEPDVWSYASCIELNDDFAITAAVDV
jgi:hypothetical protein